MDCRPNRRPSRQGSNRSNKPRSRRTTKSSSGGQSVQTLPPALAEDELLKQLLNPADVLKFTLASLDKNVVSVGTRPGKQQMFKEGKKTKATVEAPGGKIIQYDPQKGFVSTSFAEYQNTNDELTESKQGVFIKHLTTTVLNPAGPGDGKKKKKSTGGGGPTIHLQSSNYVSPQVQSNIWTNVLMYRPKERVYEYDVNTGKMKPVPPDDNSARPKSAPSREPR